jgi:hypothetical protein
VEPAVHCPRIAAFRWRTRPGYVPEGVLPLGLLRGQRTCVTKVPRSDRNGRIGSEGQSESAGLTDSLTINVVIYSELSMAFARIEELEAILSGASLTVETILREALYCGPTPMRWS